MNSNDSHLKCIYLIHGEKLCFKKFIEYTGSPKDLNICEKIYPVGYRLGIFHDEESSIDCLVSFSSYNIIKGIGDRYVKIYSGTSYVDIVRYMGMKRLFITYFYPPNFMESIGGLVAQGYPIFDIPSYEKIQLHVLNDKQEIEFLGLKNFEGTILDFHIRKPRRIKDITPSVLYLELSKDEAEYILRNREHIDNPFSLLRSDENYFMTSIIYDRTLYRGVKEFLLKAFSKDRIKIMPVSSISYDELPKISYSSLLREKELYLGVCDDQSIQYKYFYQHPSGITVGSQDNIFDEIYKVTKINENR